MNKCTNLIYNLFYYTIREQSTFMAINSIFSEYSLKKVSYYQEKQQQTLHRNSSESPNLQHDQIKRRKCIEEEYNNFFSIVAKQLENFKIQQLEKQNFLKHQIQIISNKSDNSWKQLIDQGNTYVQFFNSRHKGTQCFYNVVIGRFFLSVKVLNLHIDSSQTQTSDQCLGEGSYGKVKKIKLGDRDIALKRIYFNKAKTKRNNLTNIFKFKDFADHTEIKKAISQYCIYKICSLLKIGPQVIFENFYDLVIYNDCIEFQMELCQQVPKNVNLYEYERDIKRCLRTLHSLKIIHKDLKKQNTLYSPTFNSYVLSDFGLTHSVKQNIWQKTQTYFGGSPSHASPQMMQLLNQKNTTGFINLYINDIHCLKVTLTLLEQQIQYLQYSIVKNSMSYNDHYYDSQSAQQIGGIEIIEQFNSDEIQLNSLSSLNSQQQQQTVENLYTNQHHKRQQEISDRIGYYHIKALYQFLRVYQKYKKQNYAQLLQKIVSDIIRYKDNNLYLKIQILRIIHLNVVKLFTEEDSIINQIRNSIRIFGINSKQLYDLLKISNQKRTISFVNDSKLLQNYLNAPYKYNNIYLKKFKNHIRNMKRDIFLKNNKSAISNLRILITSYLADNSGKNAERIQILKGGLIVLSFPQLKNEEFIQFAKWIWKTFSNKQVKEKQMDKTFYLNLVNSIYQQLALRQKVQVFLLSSLIKIHQNFRQLQGAKKYYQFIKNQRQQFESKLHSNQILQNVNRFQLIRLIIKYKLYQIQYLLSQNFKKQAFQLSQQAYNKFTEYQLHDITIKINLLDYIVLFLTTTARYQECQEYIKQLKIAIQQNCFSKKNTIEHGFLYNHMATIQHSKNNYVEALKHYERVLECTDDTLRGPNYINFKKQTLQNISTCFSKLNQNQKALQYLQKCLQFTKSYMKYGEYEQQIRIIHYIIIFLFKLNRCDDYMVECINKVIKLKVQLIQTKRFIVTFQESKMLPAFPLQIVKEHGANQQFNMKVKKIVIAKTEYYFPRFIKWYIKLCQQICNFYINDKKSPSKALPYCWKMFNCISREQRTENVYKKMELFVQLLIKTNSARRAFKYLKKYFYQIPQKFQNLRIQSSKKLFQLSSDLDTNDQQFYKFIFKQKAVRNRDYLKAAEEKLIYININKFFKKIWEKKLLKIKNQMQPEQWQTQHKIIQFQQKIVQNQIEKQQATLKIIKKLGKKILIVYNPQMNCQ